MPPTITYLLQNKLICQPPKNFALSKPHYPDQGIQFVYNFYGFFLGTQYLDSYITDIYDGHFVAMWADNSGDPTININNMNSYTRTGYVKEGRKIKLKSTPLNVIQTINGECQSQGSININPTNPLNVIFNSFRPNLNATSYPELFQLWRAISFDGGKSFSLEYTGRIDGLPGIDGNLIPYIRADNNGIFDKFGNYWITMATYDATAENPDEDSIGLVILVSFDGGKNFQVWFSIPPGDDLNYHDFNQLAFGGDGNGDIVYGCAVIILMPLR